MSSPHKSKVVIVGSGPAGYTAAIYAARANLFPILVRGLQPGGQLTITTDVENYPGYAETVQGPWMMDQMEQQAARVGTQLIEDIIVEADFTSRPYVLVGDSGDLYQGETVILCTGASARWLELPSEQRFKGFGVSACATCDGFFFREKTVAVIGGGNTAVEEALFLTNFASEVILVHRRDQLRAEKILQDRLFRNPKVKIVWNHVVDEVIGDDNPPGVTGLKIRDVGNGTIQHLKLDGIFIAIGHTPNTELFHGKVAMDAEGYIITKPDSTATSVPGVFAAGDVRDKIFRQAVTAAGMGCMAALEAEKFLAADEDRAAMAAE
ncbi:MAG: thioredoxin-disulfide reductase [Rhodospirillales bacterium]|nr:thioredoxin-disulfide reductase [Rhodospirillales bacterium]